MGDPIINAQVDDINTTLGNIKVDLAALRPSIRAIRDAIAETYLTDTIENVPIASFNDGADEIPVRELEVAINPIQSLNGQTSPYPAGGGKNLSPLSSATSSSGGALSRSGNGEFGSNYKANETLTISFDCLAANQGGVRLRFNNADVHTWNAGSFVVGNRVSWTFTPTADGYINFWSGADSFAANTKVFDNIQVEKGSTATAYAPYSNICPISGHTEVNVYRTGKNLLPNLKALRDTKYVYLGQSVGSNTFYGVHLKAGTYTISCNNSVSASLYIKGSTQSAQLINSAQLNNYGTVTLPIEDDYAIWLYRSAGITTDDVTQFQLEIGSSATLYEPYLGQTYPISLGQTVYGGTLNVTTGVLTITHKSIKVSDLTWSYGSSISAFRAFNSNFDGKIVSDGQTSAQAFCTAYKIANPSTGAQMAATTYGIAIGSGISAFRLLINDPTYNGDAAAFKTAMGDTEIVYELDTPTTVQLTAEEVETLFGQNNVWCSSGNVVKLTYRKAWEIALAQGE